MLDFKSLEWNNCCCCLTLKTRIKIVGILALTKSIIICLYMISTITVYAMGIERILGNHLVQYILYYMMFLLVYLVMSFVLLLGVYQEKPEMTSWWLGFTLISVVLECVLPSIFTKGLRITVLHYPYYGLTLLSLIYNVYGLLVIYSYYRNLTCLRDVELSTPKVQLSELLEAV